MAFRADCQDLSHARGTRRESESTNKGKHHSGGRRAFWGHMGAMQSHWFSTKRNLLLMPLTLTNTARKAITKQWLKPWSSTPCSEVKVLMALRNNLTPPRFSHLVVASFFHLCSSVLLFGFAHINSLAYGNSYYFVLTKPTQKTRMQYLNWKIKWKK